jgi:hypothetical protein
MSYGINPSIDAFMKLRVRSRPEADESDVILENAGSGEQVGEIRIEVREALNAAEYTIFWEGEPVDEGTYNFQDWNDDRWRWMLEKLLADLNDNGDVEHSIEIQEWV